MHKSHLLRAGRVSLIGQTYHVTFATHERRPLFDDFCLAREAMKQFGAIDRYGDTRTHVFILMPDHVHWLFTLESGSLGRVLSRAKSRSAHAVKSTLPDTDAVWQKDYFDHALRTEDSLHAVGEYILSNPVRAGLAAQCGDYPHWFAEWV
jgi:putative transposase